MKKIFFALLIVLGCRSEKVEAQSFTLKSNDLGGQITHKQVLNGFGCTGENRSPHLGWAHAPKETRGFAVTIYDPDAPTGSGWWHWVVFDIPAGVTELVQGAGDVASGLLPSPAIQSMTDFGSKGYGGPCPPQQDKPHLYLITVYALDTSTLGLDSQASPALVGFYLQKHTLAKASLAVYYQR